MWPFRKPKPSPPQQHDFIDLMDLKQRMNDVERNFRDIRTDWNTTYDKFHALTMRMAKRVRDQNRKDAEEETPEDAPQRTNAPKQGEISPMAARLLNRGRM